MYHYIYFINKLTIVFIKDIGCNLNKRMTEITNSEEYKKEFLKNLKPESLNDSKHNRLTVAFNHALEVRKFEIDLYWRRSTYFWAFIAASFAGYFVIISSKNINQYKELTIAIALIGLLFSFGWYLVNRGSKFWQENWEEHIGMLETEIIGPLFRTVNNPRKYRLSKITDGYPFSVSKINQILSFAVILIWIYILIYSIDFYFELTLWDEWSDYINGGAFILIFLIIMVQFYKNAESSVSKEIKKAKENSEKKTKLFVR